MEEVNGIKSIALKKEAGRNRTPNEAWWYQEDLIKD